MKTAIVYYSMSGNTEYVAKTLSEKLNADLIRIFPEKTYPDKGFKKFLWGGKSAVMGETPRLMPYEFNAENYDRIIFGTPVWASSFTPPIRSFIAENKEKIKNKQFGAFLCFSGGGGEKALSKLKEFLCVSDFISTMILTDPKDNQKAENETKISEFCEKLNENE